MVVAVERVDGLLQLHPEVFVGVQGARRGDQNLRQVGVNPIVAHFVGVGERAARDVAADTRVIQSRAQSAQTNFDLAQTVAAGQLRKSHTEKLVPTRKSADLVVAAIAITQRRNSCVGMKSINCANTVLPACMRRPLPWSRPSMAKRASEIQIENGSFQR